MRRQLTVWLLCLWLLLPQSPWAAPRMAAIASAHPLATAAGFAMLEQGGNAFDAAVAVSAVLAVVEPFGSGLGGGGFWLLHRAKDGKDVFLDGRETAPLAADESLYLDAQGRPVPAWSADGSLAAGIPGLPAGLAHLARHYGRLPLSKSLQPAIQLAEQGFAVGERFVRMVQLREKTLQAYPGTAAVFLPGGATPQPGHRLVQADLARTLRRIAAFGHAGFYQGETAEKLLSAVQQAGGIWQRDDLRRYHIIERQPLTGSYRGIRIVSAPPPSSGGTVLLESLNILQGYDLHLTDTVTRKHLIIEAMRRAYRDRDLYLGDPAFVAMPIQQLTGTDYAAGLRVSIRTDRATPSANLSTAPAAAAQSHNTTHFCVLDKQGNQVAATLSINLPFGSGFVAQGTGVLLNDEMDDFAVSPGQPNAYGLVGGTANKIEPGKRMLSSMTPTFLQTSDRTALLGTPGGSRIISMVLLAVLDFAEGKGPESWVSQGRFHHQYLPDVVEYEPDSLAKPEILALESLGHVLKMTASPYGDMQAVLWERQSGTVAAASDPRAEGTAWVR